MWLGFAKSLGLACHWFVIHSLQDLISTPLLDHAKWKSLIVNDYLLVATYSI